jgi:hypothetical protein
VWVLERNRKSKVFGKLNRDCHRECLGFGNSLRKRDRAHNRDRICERVRIFYSVSHGDADGVLERQRKSQPSWKLNRDWHGECLRLGECARECVRPQHGHRICERFRVFYSVANGYTRGILKRQRKSQPSWKLNRDWFREPYREGDCIASWKSECPREFQPSRELNGPP